MFFFIIFILCWQVHAERYLIELDPSRVLPYRETADGPLRLTYQSFPGHVELVMMFPDDMTIAVVDSEEDFVMLSGYEGVVGVEEDVESYPTAPIYTQDYDDDYDQLIFQECSMMNSTVRCQRNAPWHLARSNHRIWTVPGINRTIFGNEKGIIRYNDVQIFVVDSGIQTDHPDFRGRVRPFFSNQDAKHPHGTHVAGIINSQTYGIAKGAYVLDVHVLDGQGVGSYSKILEGLAYIGRYRAPDRKCVINMSIGGPYSHILNQAVEALMRYDCFVTVAAGNDALNACYYSPSSANVMVVAATNINDRFASFSNYGQCVTMLAPGELISSLIPTNRTAIMSGTSMASPLVAGIAATYLALEPNNSPYSLRFRILSESTKNAVLIPHDDTSNVLAYFPYSATTCP